MAFEIKTEEKIYADMLGNISDDYQKTTGFLTADLTKSQAIELHKAYLSMQNVANLRLVKDLSGDELTVRVYDNKGIVRKPATNAKVELTITGTGQITKGDLFSTVNDIQFASSETKPITATGTILAECTKSGSVGMVGANSVIQIPVTISGITAVTNLSASYDGFDSESDELLKKRYYEALSQPITSGNIAHYLFWAKQVTGVGNAKVFSQWNGANTVKVLIVDNNMLPASTEVVNDTQKYIDPKGENNATWGTGAGQAPIGAYCTVASATKLDINIIVDVDLSSGNTNEEVKKKIEKSVGDYLKSIVFSETVKYVSVAIIGSLILQITGVLDYRNLTVNGVTTKVDIGAEEVAVVKDVTVS